jgi:hypothetical protein
MLLGQFHHRHIVINYGYSLSVCTKEKQCSVKHFLWPEGVSGDTVDQRLSAQYRNSVLPQQSDYKWLEKLKKKVAQVLCMRKEAYDHSRPQARTTLRVHVTWFC